MMDHDGIIKNGVYLRAVGLFVCMDPSAAMKL